MFRVLRVGHGFSSINFNFIVSVSVALLYTNGPMSIRVQNDQKFSDLLKYLCIVLQATFKYIFIRIEILMMERCSTHRL